MLEVAVNLIHVFEIKSVVQLSKLKNDVDDFWLIWAVETAMLFSVEYALAALEDEVGTNWVFCSICWFLPRLLFWQQNNCRVVLCSREPRVRFFDCVSDISPHVWSIVTIEVNQTFIYILLDFWYPNPVSKLVRIRVFWVLRRGRFDILVDLILKTIPCDLIQVVLISFPSDDVDYFVEGCFWVLLLVLWEVITQNAVIWHLLESDLWQPDTLLRHLLIKLSLGCRFAPSSVKMLLGW